jgi:Txe/YoeB family toxin of Txe-Axe toxin-antitoxin module
MTKAEAQKEIERLQAFIAEQEESVGEVQVVKPREKCRYSRRMTNEERIAANYKAAVENDAVTMDDMMRIR